MHQLAIILISTLTFSHLFAADLYWIGGVGNWTNGNNWSLSLGGAACGCIPGPNDHVILPDVAGNTCNIVGGANAAAQSVLVKANAELIVGSGGITAASLVISDADSWNRYDD